MRREFKWGAIPRKLWAACLIFVLALVVTGCSAETSSNGESGSNNAQSDSGDGAASKTLVISIPALPAGVDAARLVGPQVFSMLGQFGTVGSTFVREPYEEARDLQIENVNTGEGLTTANLDLTTVEPSAIESCKASKDGKTVRWQLAEGVTSPYGNELTSEDVVWGVERSLALQGMGAFFLSAMNADDPKQWSTDGDYSVVIKSDKPMALACSLTSHSFAMFGPLMDSDEAKKHATDDDPWATKWLTTNDASYGPYHITEWTAGEQAVMELNSNYFGDKPDIEKIIWRVVPDPSNAVALLESGEVDLSEGLGAHQVTALAQNPDIRVASQPSNISITIVMNNKQKPFDDVRVRQALNYAVPREDIVSQVYKGLSTPWAGVIPPIYQGFVEGEGYDLDLEKAKSLLEEAGHADGFSTPLAYNAGDPAQQQIAVLLQSTFAKIGVKLDLQALPPAAHSQLVQSGEAPFAVLSDGSFSPDPVFSTLLFYRTGAGGNWQNYSSAEVDKMLDECNNLLEFADRVECSKGPQEQISKDAPVVWVTVDDFMTAMKSDISGYGWNPNLFYSVAAMSRG